jgi:hypothetical protein
MADRTTDEKKPSYQLAYDERMKQIEDSLGNPKKGEERSRDPELEVRPTRDSIQLGEGSHR